MDPQSSLGETIRTRRESLGWTQKELANRVSQHGDATFRQADVSRLERGRVALPRRDRLEHIAAVLDLPLGELLARSGWTGACSAFEAAATRDPGDASFPADAASPAREATWVPAGSRQPRDVIRNLYLAIEQAKATRTSTKELLRRCEEWSLRYEAAHPRGPALGSPGRPNGPNPS